MQKSLPNGEDQKRTKSQGNETNPGGAPLPRGLGLVLHNVVKVFCILNPGCVFLAGPAGSRIFCFTEIYAR